MATPIPREYFVAESPAGDSEPAYVDIPTPTGGMLVIVTKTEAFISTKNSKRRIAFKEVIFERYERNVDGAARNTADPLTSSAVPINGPRKNGEVAYREFNDPYTSVKGMGLAGLGFRVRLSGKDRASDHQRISVAVETMTEDHLS